MRHLVVAGVLIIAALAWWQWREHQATLSAAVSLSTIERADTPEEREQGLSGRTELPDDYGMLFVFEKEGKYPFWMKDMFVPIDIIWLDSSYKIIGIEHSVSQYSYPASYTPPEPVKYVLETRAGLSQERGWHSGTTLQIPE